MRASLFYYQPNLLPPGYYTIRGGWDKARTETTWRAFNYPHVAAVYWALYRLARDHQGLVKAHSWRWYLIQAAETGIAMYSKSGGEGGLGQFGLMVGSVFPEILEDLKRENLRNETVRFASIMRERSNGWRAKQYPFGSEMPWDSTGQEEIYSWCRYFGYTEKADVTLNAILGYMPTVPNWAYNGAARRYFDAPVNGTRWPEIGRMTNHYGSTLNAIPVIAAIQDNPEDLYLMRVGYAGMDQIMSNIDKNGHGSYGFDANPAILQFDPYTADFGVAFYGYARCAGSYAFKSPEFGWLGFGAEVTAKAGSVTIQPHDGLRKRVWIAPAKLLIVLHAGSVAKVVYSTSKEEVQLTLEPASDGTDLARVRLPSNWMCTRPGTMDAQSAERGDYVVKLGVAPVTVRMIQIRR